MCIKEIHRLGREVQTNEPMYFYDLTAPSDKFNGDKTTNRIARYRFSVLLTVEHATGAFLGGTNVRLL